MKNDNKFNDFKSELKILLEKYNVYISLESDDCSDWGGITGEKMVVIDNDLSLEIGILAEDTYFDNSDLD